MRHPWEEIALTDYEAHMRLDSVGQLQALDRLMARQLAAYPARTAAILGVAGGNGLEHVDPEKYEIVYGIDVNEDYLAACAARYPALVGCVQTLCLDLTDEGRELPKADLVIADMLIEYIGVEVFAHRMRENAPRWVSCVIQKNVDNSFVSNSPYLHVFDGIAELHTDIDARALIAAMEDAGYRAVLTEAEALPNGKRFLRLDFEIVK